MIYNNFLGKKEILQAMSEHTAAQMALSGRMIRIGKRWGAIYFKLFGYPPVISSRILARRVNHYLRNRDKGEVLDVGCSHGAYGFELAKLGYSVVGIDMNRESIQLAQQIKTYIGIKNISFYEMDILSNRFANNRFDVIITFETLEHIQEDSKAIQEFHRILKEKGLLIISVPYAERVEEYNEPRGACRSKDGSYVCIGKGGSHYRNGYNLEGLNSLLEKNGFQILHYEYICIPNFLNASILSFPFKYPLSLLFARMSKNRVKLKVIAQKIPH